jgi:hypothetical protein
MRRQGDNVWRVTTDLGGYNHAIFQGNFSDFHGRKKQNHRKR